MSPPALFLQQVVPHITAHLFDLLSPVFFPRDVTKTVGNSVMSDLILDIEGSLAAPAKTWGSWY